MSSLPGRLHDLLLDALQTAFRFVPWPTQPGLRRVGQPGASSPVLVTGNYDLSVRRLLRAVEKLDAWVVVAPCGGINVWCAAAGGHLSTHQVVTALKTSGVEEHVRHRRAILPQLAATGVEGREVTRRCGWRVRFGPVYAHDLPAYLRNRGKKTDAMRHVRFGILERLEMAAAWAAPSALVLGGVAACIEPRWALPLVGLASVLALAAFLLYDRLPEPRRVLFGAAATAFAGGTVLLAGGALPAIVGAVVASILLTALLTFDYPGSTPIEGGSFFEQQSWQITLDLERCRGVRSCWEVCPKACFEIREDRREIDLAHDERCVRCGACVVQCPMDALYFEDAAGRQIPPESIRRFKLNLLGRRNVVAG